MSRISFRYGTLHLVGPPSLHRRRFGVPVGGAFDRESQMIANTLVGNDLLHPCYESAMAEVTLDFDEDATIAIVGAEAEVTLNGRMDRSNASWQIRAGDQVIIGSPRRGCRAYFAAAQFQGDREMFVSQTRNLGSIRLAEPPSSVSMAGQIEVLPANESVGIQSLRVLPAMDRLGIRCRPDPLTPHQLELPSVPICPGTLQVTPDGTVIVIGPDGPTIGGYPIVGYVRRDHLSRVAQWTPGMVAQLTTVLRREASFSETRGLTHRLAELRLAIHRDLSSR